MQVDGIVRVGDRFDIFTLESLKIETAASEEKYLCTLSTLSSPPLLFLKFLQEGSTLPDLRGRQKTRVLGTECVITKTCSLETF